MPDIREETLGAPFGMFDFAPVGLAVAAAGIAFVSLLGWRLLPQRDGAWGSEREFAQGRYVAELRVGGNFDEKDLTVGDFYPLADEHDVHVLGLVRGGRRQPGFAARQEVRSGDFIVVEGEPGAIEAFMGQGELEFAGSEKHAGTVASGGLALTEAIVPEGARIAGRTARSLKLLHRHAVTLLGVSRSGRRFRDRVSSPCDQARRTSSCCWARRSGMQEAATWMGVLPLKGRETPVVQRSKAWLSIGIFLFAIASAVAGWAPLPVALAAAVVGFVGVGARHGPRGLRFHRVEGHRAPREPWYPLAEAFEAVGGAELIAGQILAATQGFPPWVALVVLMIVTMTLSDFLNNVATTLIAAPVALGVAAATGTNPDAWLMAVAVAASCAFLTPVGHKNNTIILGAGRLSFRRLLADGPAA